MVITLTPFFLLPSSPNQMSSAHLSLQLLLNPIKDPLPPPITLISFHPLNCITIGRIPLQMDKLLQRHRPLRQHFCVALWEEAWPTG